MKLLSISGFKLTKFVSNVPTNPPQVGTNTTSPTEIPNTEKSSHVLGLKWNHSSDTLVVSRGTNPEIKVKVTQRIVLSLVSSQYDPIGLVAPHTVKARPLLKDIWTLSGQQWDDDLPPEVVSKFLDWSEKLRSLSDIIIPRAYFQRNIETLELHLFGDSSELSFSYVPRLSRKKIKNKHNSSSYSERPE